MAKAGFHPTRGQLVDIGGRRLRMVRAGPQGAEPLILLECGAFGCAADWAEVQHRLATKGLASLAYDRAGLGFSEPGPKPRDGAAPVTLKPTLARAPFDVPAGAKAVTRVEIDYGSSEAPQTVVWK